jgi:hypothetical protein
MILFPNLMVTICAVAAWQLAKGWKGGRIGTLGLK